MAKERISSAVFVAAAARPEQVPAARLPEVAFAGRSNVGKSSLLNRLTGCKGLARVSKTPGRTQQIHFFCVNERWLLVDLPGYGFARVPLAVRAHWKDLVESYLTDRRTLRTVVVIVDARRGIEKDDASLIEFLDAHGVASIVAATKIDKLKRSERARALTAIRQAAGEHDVIMVSSLSGEGIEQLRAAVLARLEG